jgi:hypothetical protein
LNGAARALAIVGIVVAILMATASWYPFAYGQSDASPQVYTSELTGWQVEVAGPDFALQDAALEEYPHGRGERITINGVDSLSYVEVAFFDDEDSPEETIAVTMREFQATSQRFTILDSGTAGGVSYALAVFQLNVNVTGYVYMQVEPDVTGNVDFAQSLFTLNLDFPEQLVLASGQITVGDHAFLDDPVIDVASRIAEHAEANPAVTPTRSSYDFETVNSTVDVNPPVSLDFSSNANGFEAVNVSNESSFGIIGYLKQEAYAPVDVLDGIFASAPRGDEAPKLIHSDETRERVFAVYRIHRDGGVTIMVVLVTAMGPDMWRVEALAGPEGVIITELEVFQQSIVIDTVPFLNIASGDALADILNGNQP